MSTLLERPPSDLSGSQTPRYSLVPPATHDTLGQYAVDFAAKAGLHLDPWQQTVLRGSMGLTAERKWAARNVGLLVPRQSGKGAVLEARELFGLFVLNEKLIIHSAHKFDTSQEHFLRMRTLIEGNPDLERHVASTMTANGKESINLRNGARLKFKARTVSGSGRGFSADLLVLDEAMLLPDAALAAMLPTLITRPNPQVWWTSSAGTPDSTALWRLVKRGRAGAERLAYWEWGCDVGADVTDRREWAKANPGLGYRLPMEALEDEFDNLTPEDFAREHLGVWDDHIEGVFPSGAWQALEDSASSITGSPIFAVDVTFDRSSSSIGVAGPRTDGIAHVEDVAQRRGSEWVIDWLPAKVLEHNAGGVVVDPGGPAGPLIPELESRGVKVFPTTAREYGQACTRFYDRVIEGKLRHLGLPALDAAVRGARQRPLGESWAWDRKHTSVDIAPLNAVSLALWGYEVHGGLDPAGSIW